MALTNPAGSHRSGSAGAAKDGDWWPSFHASNEKQRREKENSRTKNETEGPKMALPRSLNGQAPELISRPPAALRILQRAGGDCYCGL